VNDKGSSLYLKKEQSDEILCWTCRRFR